MTILQPQSSNGRATSRHTSKSRSGRKLDSSPRRASHVHEALDDVT